MRWDKDHFQHEENKLRYWYHELPFIGEGVDLLLARKVWTIIYVPLLLLSIFGFAHSLINWNPDLWLVIPSSIGGIWSFVSLHFIWIDA